MSHRMDKKSEHVHLCIEQTLESWVSKFNQNLLCITSSSFPILNFVFKETKVVLSQLFIIEILTFLKIINPFHFLLLYRVPTDRCYAQVRPEPWEALWPKLS
jgi:hypothetical protein